MKNFLLTIVATICVFPLGSLAQAPAGSTGECRDGSFTSAAKKSGACSGHKGVKSWYAAADKPSSSSAAPSSATSESQPAQTTPAEAKPTASERSNTSSMQQAAGGGPGLVWVNTSSKVYHCEGTAYYGKTRQGKYMSEADAKAMGAHADHAKACSQ